jgi:predicted aspartyl protease
MTWTVQRMAKRVRAGVMGKAPSSPSALRGRVEALDGLLIVGWASVVGAAQNERITLWAQGAQVDAAVVRVEREDVRQAIEGASLHSGFEIEVPSQIWLDVPPEGQVELQVRVDGQPVPAVVDLRLSRVMLSRELAELLAISEQAAGLSGVQAQRYQYRLLTAIEHAYRAGLLPGLSRGCRPSCASRQLATHYSL